MLASRRSLVLGAASLATPALAQSWPSRPVRLIVPYAPGGFQTFLGEEEARWSRAAHEGLIVRTQ